jgi:hypothetical protein
VHITVKADSEALAIVVRAFHGAVAFGVTLILATFVGLEVQSCREVAILNAGLAFYTATAVDHVVAALNRLPRVQVIHAPQAEDAGS